MPVYYREAAAVVSDEPTFVISVAARLVEMHPQTLRYYERAGLVKPKRSRGSIRLYSQRDIDRLRKIARLVDELGVNLAGVEVILNLTEKLELMQQLLEQYQIPLPQTSDETPSALPDARLQTVSAASPDVKPVKIQVRRPRAPSDNSETPKPKRSNRNDRSNDRAFGAR